MKKLLSTICNLLLVLLIPAVFIGYLNNDHINKYSNTGEAAKNGILLNSIPAPTDNAIKILAKN